MDYLKEILLLKSGDSFIVPESDYGKAEVWKINDMYILFEIPMYGGKPMFSGTYSLHQINDLIETIENWT